MTIGKNIKKLREEKGVTQAQVANDLFITPQMICAIENDMKQPSLNIALAMANYFGVSVEKLVGRS